MNDDRHPEQWVIQICPECRCQVYSHGTVSHTGACPNRDKLFSPKDLFVVPASPVAVVSDWVVQVRITDYAFQMLPDQFKANLAAELRGITEDAVDEYRERGIVAAKTKEEPRA